ncbi:MAG: TetR/AcrR family transcriptional regulator [Candidatus Competibacteraceae bacterium]|nr:TetR/AcrR family transcriptional regulator [Candidatus Competibacteraceae bacterium]
MNEPTQKSKAEARCEAQRERILSAARKCSIESGFHAASMASIAETAGVSAGLIYRYFESKNAIILAIIQRKLDEIQADIRELQSLNRRSSHAAHQVVRRLAAQPVAILEPGLFLEIAALATRDQQVAEALRSADQRVRAELRAWLMQAWEKAGCGLAEAQALERVFVMQAVIEGLVIRAIKQPDSDPDLVKDSLRPLLAYLLPVD